MEFWKDNECNFQKWFGSYYSGLFHALQRKRNATADVEIGKSACKVGHQLIPSLKQLMNFYAFQMYWVSKQVWKIVVSNIPKLGYVHSKTFT